MSIDTTPSERLTQALIEFQAALDLGLPVSSEAFMERFADVPDLAGHLQALQSLRPLPSAQWSGPTLRLSDFEDLEQIGRGGMGVVYKARQKSLNRLVALKVHLQASTLDERARRRFLQEAHTAAILNHESILPIYQVGEENGIPYFVMPLVDGLSGASWLQQVRQNETACKPLPKPFSPEFYRRLAQLGIELARALEVAHSYGVIHRDIKPGNVLLDYSGKVWLSDFGLALGPVSLDLTRTGLPMGTPRYMSPEQRSVIPVSLDGRSDLFSLGLTLYEMLTLRPAYPDEVLANIHLPRSMPIPPRKVRPTLPRDLETIVLKSMSPELADRYLNASELAADLQRFLDDQPVLARRPHLGIRFSRWLRRHRFGVTTTSTAVAIGVFTGIGLSLHSLQKAYRDADADRQFAFQALRELGKASDDVLAHSPGLEARQIAYLERVRQTLDELQSRAELAADVQFELGVTHYRIGENLARRRLISNAESHFRSAISTLTQLTTRVPDNSEYWLKLANAHYQLGQCLIHQDQHEAAVPFFRQAVQNAEKALELKPNSANALADLQPFRFRVVEFENRVYKTNADLLAVYLDSWKVYLKLKDEYPVGHPRSYMRLAEHAVRIAVEYRLKKNYAEAISWAREAMKHDHHLRDNFPDDPLSIRENCRQNQSILGTILIEAGEVEEGEALLQNGIADQEQAIRQLPGILSYKEYLALSLMALAQYQIISDQQASWQITTNRLRELLPELGDGFRQERTLMITLVLMESPK